MAIQKFQKKEDMTNVPSKGNNKFQKGKIAKKKVEKVKGK